LLILSIVYESQIPAFVGLGLTFWGALFFLVRPIRYVHGSLLYDSALSSYSTIDRIVKDFGYKGGAYYIPPYPKDVYLPEHLKGLKEAVVFLSAKKDGEMPSIEELAGSKFRLEPSKGVLITSPGLGLFSQIEKELNVDFTKTKLADLPETLPRAVTENLNLAREMELEVNGNQVQVRITDSLYRNLYSMENDFKSVIILGCPLVSAVACALAKASGKPVTIQKAETSPDGLTTRVSYRILQEKA
jgi:hypothetical protein